VVFSTAVKVRKFVPLTCPIVGGVTRAQWRPEQGPRFGVHMRSARLDKGQDIDATLARNALAHLARL